MSEKTFYQMDFYLDSDCDTEFSELNDVTFRSEKIDNLADRLRLIKNFRKNVHTIYIFKFENGRCNSLFYSSEFEQLEDWFKERGLLL